MANEASKIELFGNNSAGDVMQYTVSSSASIPLGTLMVLSASPRTMAAHSSEGQIFVGVANAEKDSSDTSTDLGVWQNGVFKMAASGTISDGDQVILGDTANYVAASNAITEQGHAKLVGIALNDASGGLVVVRVRK